MVIQSFAKDDCKKKIKIDQTTIAVINHQHPIRILPFSSVAEKTGGCREVILVVGDAL